MSNDTYSGSSLRNLRASTPEDADGFNVDARALRQIKRFLKNDDGLLQTLADIFTSDNNTILNNFKDSQVYNRNNQVIALRSDIDPNNSSKFSGRWIKLNGQAICATGNANFNTFAYGTSDDFVGIPITDYTLNWVKWGDYEDNDGVLTTKIIDGETIQLLSNSYIRSRLYIIIPLFIAGVTSLDLSLNNGGATSRGIFSYPDLTVNFWLASKNSYDSRYHSFGLFKLGKTQSYKRTFTKNDLQGAKYFIVSFGERTSNIQGFSLRNNAFINITAIGNNPRWTPNYELNWILKATQYANCTLEQIVEKHSNRTYRNMLRVNKEANDVAKLQKIYFYTPVGYLANITDVSFSLKNAWSLFSQECLDIFPNLALSGNLFLPKYKNYKVKITLSKDPVWNPDGIIIGETTIEEAIRNGVYFNNIKNTYTDRAYGYIVFSVVDPQEIELEEDTLWWLVDLEMTINLNMPFNNETYRVTDIEVGKNYESVLPILGMNFWKRLDDGKE